MNILVTYDIADTESKAGARRLRKVAIICKDYGQRVQFSVFECEINEMQFEVMRSKLLKAIDANTDSVRFYKFRTYALTDMTRSGSDSGDFGEIGLNKFSNQGIE